MLRALDHGLRLVADDRTQAFVSSGRLFGAAPRALAGLIEVRGVGIVAPGALPTVEIFVRVRCVMTPR